MSYEWDFLHQSRVRLDTSWPGLQAPATEIKVDPDTLEQLGSMLVGQANSLESDNSHLPSGVSYLDDARRSTTVGFEQATDMPAGERWFGGWRTAVMMGHSLNTAQSSILYYYQQLVGQLRAAGELFRATADDYRAVDQGARVDLEARAAGWDQVAAPVNAGGGQSGGVFRDATEVPYISEYEDVSRYDPKWVLEQIETVRSTQPWWKLYSAGGAFAATSDRLAGVARTLKSRAESLTGEWESDTSVACQQALRRIAATAEHLAETSEKLSSFANRSAEVLQERVSGFPTDLDRSTWETVTDVATIGSNPDQERKENEVRDALALLNEAYRDVNYTTLPGQVAADLPQLPGAGEGVDRPPPPPPYQPPSAPTLPNPPLSPAPQPATGMDAAGPAPPVGTGITGFPGTGEPVGAGVGSGPGSSGGGIPGVVGLPAGDGADWSPGGLAGAGPVGAGAGGIGPGGVGPGGVAGGAGPGGVGVPGPAGPGAGAGPGPVGMAPGAAGRGGAAGGPPGGRSIPGVGPGAGGRPGPGGVLPVGGAGAQGQGSGGGRTGGTGPGGRPGVAGGAGGGVVGGRPGSAGGPGGTGPGGRPGVGGGPSGGALGGRPAVGGGGLAGAGGAARPGMGGGMMPLGGGAGAGGRDKDQRRTGGKPGPAGGPTGGATGAAGAGGAGGAGAAVGAGAGVRPGGMMPVGAGRGGDKEQPSQHDSWLVEDDDPWRGDDDVPPPVIR